MRYRVECLTPTLIGDGSALSPIDYMVWKDQVNVLNQRRIFKLLSRGPRLDGYLTQIKKDEKLDFASWGGFAQNYAERRIPFEHPSYAAYWERLRADFCHIPTFSRTIAGPVIPASALRGALRTTLVASRTSAGTLATIETLFQGDRPPRRPGESAEHQVVGRPSHDALKGFAIADSAPAVSAVFKIYMLRTATLVETRGGSPGTFGLGWRTVPRGTVEPRRIDDSTPSFAEMAAPGTAFEGVFTERSFYQNPEVARSLGWRHPLTRERLFEAANRYAETLLDAHFRFATAVSLPHLTASVEQLRSRLQQAREQGACLLNLGWATGLLPKMAFPNTDDEAFRRILSRHPEFARAIRTGMPFPKTRRVVFLENQPATLPGWVWLGVG